MRFYSLIIGLALGITCANAQITKALFIGNSYTGVNNLPLLVKNVALSMGDTLFTDSNTPGGYTYNLHTTNTTTQTKIQAEQWDYVILQEQSQIPSLPSSITGNDYSVPHSVTLNSMIKTNNPCTETVFYMTWGRKNGDASYCAQHPPVCTYTGMQQELRNTYMFMADSNQATVSPVGVAWSTVRDSFPLIELYSQDESHPSIHGSYLAACVFYVTFFQKSCIGSTFMPSGIGTGDAVTLQTVATNTVLDSLSLWRINANKPIANFNYSGGGTVNFNNTSTNGVTYFWDFGDGNTDTQEHPSNTYINNGTYTVQLITFSNDSCFSDTIIQSINVINTGINNSSNKTDFNVYPNPANNLIRIQTELEYTTVIITNLMGKTIKTYSSNSKIINISNLANNIYLLKLIGDNETVVKKFVKN